MKKIGATRAAPIRSRMLTGIVCWTAQRPRVEAVQEPGTHFPLYRKCVTFSGYSFGTQETMDAGLAGEPPEGGAVHHSMPLLQVYPLDQV